jgi:hypothetical protein
MTGGNYEALAGSQCVVLIHRVLGDPDKSTGGCTITIGTTIHDGL